MNIGVDLHGSGMLLEFFHLQTLHGNNIVIPSSLGFGYPSEANAVYLSYGLKA